MLLPENLPDATFTQTEIKAGEAKNPDITCLNNFITSYQSHKSEILNFPDGLTYKNIFILYKLTYELIQSLSI